MNKVCWQEVKRWYCWEITENLAIIVNKVCWQEIKRVFNIAAVDLNAGFVCLPVFIDTILHVLLIHFGNNQLPSFLGTF